MNYVNGRDIFFGYVFIGNGHGRSVDLIAHFVINFIVVDVSGEGLKGWTSVITYKQNCT